MRKNFRTPPLNPPLVLLYQKLFAHFGPLNWWPANSPFEVVVGAILTQNTAWTNVEQAIINLKNAGLLSARRIAETPTHQLEGLIRPSGFFRQKAIRLQDLSRHLVMEWQNDLNAFCSGPLDETRRRLLARPGIGPETADSILLYAANRPSFVIDAYTRRIFVRIGILHGNEKYHEVRDIFMRELPEDVELYNEYHAQIVQLAKTCCKKQQPLCNQCPLRKHCCYAKRSCLAGENQDSPGRNP